ncbi:unnamed protein product [Arabidopsis halleri]
MNPNFQPSLDLLTGIGELAFEAHGFSFIFFPSPGSFI